MRGGAVAVLAVAAALVPAGAALANGTDLSRPDGKPGDEIDFAGHFWVTPCCPSNPYERVRLFLLDGNERIELLEAIPDPAGSIFSTFEVPDVDPGVYRLEPCGENEGEGLDCRPPASFRVLPGGLRGGSGSGVSPILIAVLVGVGAIGAAGVVFLGLRRSRA